MCGFQCFILIHNTNPTNAVCHIITNLTWGHFDSMCYSVNTINIKCFYIGSNILKLYIYMIDTRITNLYNVLTNAWLKANIR